MWMEQSSHCDAHTCSANERARRPREIHSQPRVTPGRGTRPVRSRENAFPQRIVKFEQEELPRLKNSWNQ